MYGGPYWTWYRSDVEKRGVALESARRLIAGDETILDWFEGIEAYKPAFNPPPTDLSELDLRSDYMKNFDYTEF